MQAFRNVNSKTGAFGNVNLKTGEKLGISSFGSLQWRDDSRNEIWVGKGVKDSAYVRAASVTLS